MKLLYIFVFFILIIPLSICNLRSIYTYEFGVNIGTVIYAKSGKIGLFEKTDRVPIIVPDCAILTYIRVDVDNLISEPDVSLDYDMSTVVISYNTWQYSKSSYVVAAKAIFYC